MTTTTTHTDLEKIVEQLEDLFAHKSWGLLEEFVEDQLKVSRANLEVAPNPDVHVYQGEIRAYKYVLSLPTQVEVWRENALEDHD